MSLLSGQPDARSRLVVRVAVGRQDRPRRTQPAQRLATRCAPSLARASWTRLATPAQVVAGSGPTATRASLARSQMGSARWLALLPFAAWLRSAAPVVGSSRIAGQVRAAVLQLPSAVRPILATQAPLRSVCVSGRDTLLWARNQRTPVGHTWHDYTIVSLVEIGPCDGRPCRALWRAR